MATATATAVSSQEQVKTHEAKIARLKAAILEYEAELNLLHVKQRKASSAELTALLRRKETVEASLDRDRAALTEETDAATAVWGSIRREEERERYARRIAEPENLKAETLRAVSDYCAGLAALNSQGATIVRGVQGLRRIMDGAAINSFPIPPECLAAQVAMGEVNEALRALRQTFEGTLH